MRKYDKIFYVKNAFENNAIPAKKGKYYKCSLTAYECFSILPEFMPQTLKKDYKTLIHSNQLLNFKFGPFKLDKNKRIW